VSALSDVPARASSEIMSAYKTQQHRLVHRGRSFHFVSYEGQAADLKRQTAATPPTWYIMLGGKRWAVMAQTGEVEPATLESRFVQWLDENVFVAGSVA
jgi:hypothetical protein